MSAKRKSNSHAGYHRFLSDDNEAYGSFEVCYLDKRSGETPVDEWDGKHAPSGWYWVAGFPGCLWDGDPLGPYDTSIAAYKAAQDI